MSMVTVMLASMAGLMLTPASAADSIVENRQSINYAREDLMSDAGVQRLRLEIIRTARSVCNDDGSRFTRFSRETRECIADAYADGIAQLEVKVAEARNTSRSYAQAVVNAGGSAH